MKNIKFKTAIIALSLSAALALSATACSSSDDKKKDDADTTTKVEETEKETEETTEETTTEATTEETTEADANGEGDADMGGNLEMPDAATPDDFDDERVKDFAKEAEAANVMIMKIDQELGMAEDVENFVEGFLATGGSMSVSASADDEGNTDSSIGEDSSFKVYMCYLFEDSDTAAKYFDQQVTDMFSYYDESTYKIEETENGKILKYDDQGVTVDMEVDGELFTMVEIIGA